jgi:hypothetical protein
MNPRTAQAMMMAADRVQKYAKRGGFYSRLLRNPSALAEFLKSVGGMFSTKPVSEREVARAAELARALIEKGGEKKRPGWDDEALPRADVLARRQMGEELRESEQQILTPGSSNVYSFAYQAESRTRGILYITYRHGKATGKAERKNSCTGEKYTVGVKPNVAGPTYAYYDVPVTVYNRLKTAQSKGSEIWQSLRICGSVFGHQYRYTLVEGAKIGPNFDDVYVPRRATQTGFKKRAVRLTGRKQFVASTLRAERKQFRGVDNDVYRSAVKRFRGSP